MIDHEFTRVGKNSKSISEFVLDRGSNMFTHYINWICLRCTYEVSYPDGETPCGGDLAGCDEWIVHKILDE